MTVGPKERLVAEINGILHPRSIAVVGASTDEDKIATQWLKSFVSRGFKGELYGVNPKGGRVLGRRIWPDLASIPGIVDLVIVCTPRSTVRGIVEDAARKGIRAMYFYTAGFSEAGDPGWAAVEQEIVSIARAAGFRIIGPNCFGVYNPKYGMPYGPFDTMAPPGSIGLIVQSGGHMGKILEFGLMNNLGFGKGVSLGNSADLGAADFLEYLAQDSETKIIGLYIEGQQDTRQLFEVMRSAAAVKPLVVWKGGASPAGMRAAASHTGALASSSWVWSAALRQAGAIEVHSLDEMTDTLMLLDRFGRLSRSKAGAICGLTDGGGGESVLISDVCAAEGIDLPPLREQTAREIVALVGQIGSVLSNPVDMSQRQDEPEVVRRILELVASEPQIDLLLIYESTGVILDYYPWEVIEAVNRVVLEFARKRVKPLVLVLPLGISRERRSRIERDFVDAGIPVFCDIRRAAVALDGVCLPRRL